MRLQESADLGRPFPPSLWRAQADGAKEGYRCSIRFFRQRLRAFELEQHMVQLKHFRERIQVFHDLRVGANFALLLRIPHVIKPRRVQCLPALSQPSRVLAPLQLLLVHQQRIHLFAECTDHARDQVLLHRSLDLPFAVQIQPVVPFSPAS